AVVSGPVRTCPSHPPAGLETRGRPAVARVGGVRRPAPNSESRAELVWRAAPNSVVRICRRAGKLVLAARWKAPLSPWERVRVRAVCEFFPRIAPTPGLPQRGGG